MELWDGDVCQRNHYMALYFKANYPRLMKLYLVLKDHKVAQWIIPTFWSPHHYDTFFTSYPGWWGNWWHNSTQIQKNLLKVFQGEEKKKQKKNRERGREVPDRWPAADAVVHFFVSYVYLPLWVSFFPPKIWKHGLAIERLVEGFCFIMH